MVGGAAAMVLEVSLPPSSSLPPTTEPLWTPENLIYIILELLIAIFSVLGNVLVCWAVYHNSNLQTITNFFLVSLAVADIAVGVLAIPFSIAISTGFCSKFYGCLFMVCFVLILTQSSIFSLLAIAIDRYIAIKFPLRYNSLVTDQRAQGIIAICWVLSIIIGLTPMMGWNGGPKPPKNCPPGLIECMFEDVVEMTYMVYFNFFGCVLLPLLLMLAIYLCIFMAARHQLKLMELKVVHGAEKSSSTLQKEVQAAKSLAIIVGLFAVCWLPLHIINCFTLFGNGRHRPPELVMFVAIILSHGNSVINPLIYAYRIREFRQTFRRIICHSILGRPPQLGGSSSSSGGMRTSIYNSIGDSIRASVNGARVERLPQQGGGSSEAASVQGSLVAVSHPPLSIIVSHCPPLLSCPHRLLRQTRSSVHPPLQQAEAPGKVEERREAGSARVTMLLNDGKSTHCLAELVS